MKSYQALNARVHACFAQECVHVGKFTITVSNEAPALHSYLFRVLTTGAGLPGMSSAEKAGWWSLLAQVIRYTADALRLVPRHDLGTHTQSYQALLGAQAPLGGARAP